MIELVDEDIKCYCDTIPHVQHGRLKQKHAKERHGKHEQGEERNI